MVPHCLLFSDTIIFSSFLLCSVMLCYIIALASVYGKSVALLRAQLKLVRLFKLKWFSNT